VSFLTKHLLPKTKTNTTGVTCNCIAMILNGGGITFSDNSLNILYVKH